MYKYSAMSQPVMGNYKSNIWNTRRDE